MIRFILSLLLIINSSVPTYAQSIQRVLSADAVEGVVAPTNLVRNSNFAKTTEAWSAYSGSGGTPTGSTGGVLGSNPTISVVTDTSFNSFNKAGAIAKSGANVQGSGIKTGFSLPLKYRGKLLKVSFDYKLASGTFVNGDPTDLSSTGDSSLTIWAKDDSNSAILPLSQNRLYDVSSTATGRFSATFQAPSNSSSITLLFHQARTETTAYDLRIANVVVTEQVAPTGAVVTDEVAYTPTFTGFGTASAINIKSWRSGQYLFFSGNFTSGTPTATEARITLGYGGSNGNVTTANDLPSVSVVGFMEPNNVTASGTTVYTVLAEPNVNYLTFGFRDSSSAPLTKQTGTALASNGLVFSFFGKVKIQGWSSGVTMSSDNSGRLISFQGNKLTTQNSVTANTVDITYTAVKDSTGSWNGSQYSVFEPGDYVFTLSGSSSAATTLIAYINGTAYKQIGDFSNLTNNTISIMIPNLTTGQSVSFRVGTTVNINGGALPAPAGLSIFKISNPSAIAQSDNIIAIYTDTSGATIGTSQAVYKYTTKVKDTHGAYNTSTGIFTAPEPGTYRVTYTLALGGSLSLSTTQRFATYVLANGTGITATKIHGNGLAISMFLTQSVEYPLLAGQTLQVQAASDVAQAALSTSGFNSLSIMKVGNY